MMEEFEELKDKYSKLVEMEDSDLPLSPAEHMDSDRVFNVEDYWINLYKKSGPYKKLAKFFINMMLIPHSNSFTERVFSIVKHTKTDLRNLLDVSTVSAIVQIKTYYSEDEMLEIDEDHFFCYRHSIKEYEKE